MHCQSCGLSQFQEENGVFFCCYCGTQSQGFSQESGQDYIDMSKLFSRTEVTKKRIKRGRPQKTGVLWTTTEAFSLILFKQMESIFAINSETIELKEMHDLTQLIWSTYLYKSEMVWTVGESQNNQVVTRRLHPASRFRDVQILVNRVENCLPPFKNGSTEGGFSQLFSLKSDGVIRTFRDSKEADDFFPKISEQQNDYELFDIFFDEYRDPRNHAKIRSHGMKLSKESRKQLNTILSKVSSDLSSNEFENFDDFDENIKPDENLFITDQPISDEVRDSKDLDSFDDFDKELMKNMTERTRLFSQYIPLSYLKNSRNNKSNYFIDLMSLPKTLSILNVVIRLLCYDIYCFDLIRWANEGHIPYNNCLMYFPKDWLLIANDFHCFTSSCVPSMRTIAVLSMKMAHYVDIKSFPRPNLEQLLIRFAKDLNLPKDIVGVIHLNYNLFEHFPTELDKMSAKCRAQHPMPYYEIWTLMAILLVLKRIFILNDRSETFLSRSAEKESNLFIWDEWESYTRERVELIRSFFIPSYNSALEDIRDADLIGEHYLQKSGTQPLLGLNRNAPYRFDEFLDDAQQEFKQFLFGQTEDQSTETLITPSLYPLINATDFALSRKKCLAMNEKMSVSFENKITVAWTCSHNKVFHRGYQFLSKDPKNWSQSFKLLIYLSCFILNCRVETLIPILKQMERKYFGKGFD